MRASESKWPYRPAHITNDGENSKQQNMNTLVGVGIISNEYVQGLQNSISGDLGYPTLIVEFPPTSKGKPVHTDSKLRAPYGIRPACGELRDYTNCKLCHECDDIHALLFRSLNKSNLRTEIEKQLKDNAYLKELREYAYIKNYLLDYETETHVKTISGREYLEYDCWVLSLRELLFPILFEGKVIAVFFTGQICLDWKSEFIKRRQKEFLSPNLDCYCDKLLGEENLLTQHHKQRIVDTYKAWIGEKKDQLVLKKQQYEELIGCCYYKIEALEEMLKEQMSLQRNRYVRRRTERGIKKFREQLPTKKHSSDEKWDLLWKNIKERFDELCSDFAIEYIVAFAAKGLEEEAPSLLNVMVTTENLPGVLK